MKDEQERKIRVEFYLVDRRNDRSHLTMESHLHKYFQTIHSALLKIFDGATKSGREMACLCIRIIMPINVPKCQGGEIHVF